MTLKDVDFDKIEKKIWINRNIAKTCATAIEKDSRFFCNMNIIDYSLIVFKINWAKYCIDNEIEMETIFKKFNKQLNIIES